MNKADQQDVTCTRLQASRFQAASLARDEDSILSISTARRSSIEAKGMCSACGMRANRDDLQICSHCGSPLCPDCFRQAQRKEKRSKG
ncbi:MAG TPA: hypothetical protein VN426_15270 [Syntrophomonadaceae bacterium]|nr:hypothetical protein [Syntrophomonadaceae bacterium]